MIPKLLHQIWFQGEANIPDKFNSYRESWRKHNPTYSFATWNEKSINEIMPNELKETYDSFDLTIQKIDYAKYVILYLHGGMYVDMDMMCLRSLDTLLDQDKDLIVGYA